MRAIAILVLGAIVGCGRDQAPSAAGSNAASATPAGPPRRQQGPAWAEIEAELARAHAEVVRTEALVHDAQLALAAAGAPDRRAAQVRLDTAEQARRAASASYDRWQARAMEFSLARPPEDEHPHPMVHDVRDVPPGP